MCRPRPRGRRHRGAAVLLRQAEPGEQTRFHEGDDPRVFDGLLAGASGFLLKQAPPEEILLAVRAAAAGDALVSPAPMRRLVEHFIRGRPRQSADLDRLTNREREVLVLMARGLSNAAIARSLAIGETTAKTHVTRVLTKLRLRDRAHAVVYGYETGLVRPGEGGAQLAGRQ